MRSESVTVHKGGREERYKIYVEDYVISYLKTEADTLEMAKIFFYGYYEEEKNKIVIYGAGKGKNLTFFDKYDLLEQITCRLTQAGPVFAVREKEELYEVLGYDIFYHENIEMQNYMIACKRQDEHTHRGAGGRDAEPVGSHLHYTLTLQLGVIFVILVAIVINSTNSYDRMEQLNQSAKEVFFALENQEAEEQQPENLAEAVEEQPAENVESVTAAEDIDIVQQSGGAAGEAASGQNGESAETEEISETAPAVDETDAAKTGAEGEDLQIDMNETQQSTEALSRNVVRYYEIERGDTLYTICKEIYGDTSKVQQICDLNQITDPDDIRYGQKIILP